MSSKKSYPRYFRIEAARLTTERGHSIAEASRSLGVEYRILRRWRQQSSDDPGHSFPGKSRLKATDEELRRLKRKLDRVKEERDSLKKSWPALRRIRDGISVHL